MEARITRVSDEKVIVSVSVYGSVNLTVDLSTGELRPLGTVQHSKHFCVLGADEIEKGKAASSLALSYLLGRLVTLLQTQEPQLGGPDEIPTQGPGKA